VTRVSPAFTAIPPSSNCSPKLVYRQSTDPQRVSPVSVVAIPVMCVATANWTLFTDMIYVMFIVTIGCRSRRARANSISHVAPHPLCSPLGGIEEFV
jgi:hypothetical protein